MYTSVKVGDMSTPHKRKQIMVDRQRLTSTYNDSGAGLYEINGGCKSTINDLDLAHGLIELLVENNFTLKSLMNTSSSELSKTLDIDQEVATLICKTAKKTKKPRIRSRRKHMISYKPIHSYVKSQNSFPLNVHKLI